MSLCDLFLPSFFPLPSLFGCGGARTHGVFSALYLYDPIYLYNHLKDCDVPKGTDLKQHHETMLLVWRTHSERYLSVVLRSPGERGGRGPLWSASFHFVHLLGTPVQPHTHTHTFPLFYLLCHDASILQSALKALCCSPSHRADRTEKKTETRVLFAIHLWHLLPSSLSLSLTPYSLFFVVVTDSSKSVCSFISLHRPQQPQQQHNRKKKKKSNTHTLTLTRKQNKLSFE